MTIASYQAANPTSIIANAMFNFDAFGKQNFKLNGTVYVSTSWAFDYNTYLANSTNISSYTYTSSSQITWSASQLSYLNQITSTYSSFANISFASAVDYSQNGYSPLDVGTLSNINISFIYRPDFKYSGEAALGNDTSFKYAGSAGDIVLNYYEFGSNGLNNDTSLNPYSYGWHTLMHEIGHNLGLSHPHLSYSSTSVVLTADYSATTTVGFNKLGFHINNPIDMNKEYFTVMSYDDEVTPTGKDTFALTPMILDVIALQEIYGAGSGTSGSGNDTITPGTNGSVDSFRTYFDTGGIDTVNLINYTSGAYLNMGTTIDGAPHLVGVCMSYADGINLINNGNDPSSLRWLYGEYENAIGSTSNDLIYGNALNNVINGNGGSDTIDGGGGSDTVVFSGSRSSYRIGTLGGTTIVSGSNVYDKLTNIANLQFSDGVVDNNASTATDVLVAVNKSGVATYELPDAYSGPVNYLNYQYLGAAGSDIAVGTSKNDFFNLGAGDDAANGSAGDDVLDGGTGSNFLTGGAGWDTFFIDGRGNSTTWGTITDYTLANGSTPNWPDP